VIESSLFAAIAQAGGQDQLALDMAEIFGWQIDFSTEVQRGDTFRVAVEAFRLDGRFVRYGRILAAELVRGDRPFQAVHFAGERTSGYFAPDGTPVRRAFLRSPLKFTRISSRFTRRRFHPVLGVYRPHYGVDYAAPTGTPVQAAGDGTVSRAGWESGYGKTVRVRHPNGYETLYGHLSRILVKPRQRVSQGETIGRVGMTGLATGPHLDYRMLKNGAYVDPLKVVSPPAAPVPAAERARFESRAAQAMARLDPAPASGRIQLAEGVR
jgi:murein DD-endopeptidase MepM/ murein hydrolase activator NlpD